MSEHVIPAWTYTSYVDGVVQKLQTKGHLLAGTAMAPTSINGNEVQWFTGGRMETEKIVRTGGDDAAVQQPARGNIKANFEDFGAMAFIEGVDINNIKPNEMAQIETEGAAAIGRRSDWIQLFEMNARAEASDIETIGNGSADIDVLNLMEAEGKIMGIGDASIESMFCVLPIFAFQRLCLIKEFNNADYTGPDLAFTKMTMRRTWGFTNYFVLPNEYFMRPEMGVGGVSGVPVSGNFCGFMWWKGGIGFQRRDPPAAVKMQYVVPKRGTYIDHLIGGLSKTLQPDAIKRLHFNWSIPARLA